MFITNHYDFLALVFLKHCFIEICYATMWLNYGIGMVM